MRRAVAGRARETQGNERGTTEIFGGRGKSDGGVAGALAACYHRAMLVALVFAFGVVNIYCHRAVMEGRGPVFGEIAAVVHRIGGRWGSYAVEMALLVVALWFAREGEKAAAMIYGGYTLLNVGGYLMLRRFNGR